MNISSQGVLTLALGILAVDAASVLETMIKPGKNRALSERPISSKTKAFWRIGHDPAWVRIGEVVL